MSSLAWRKREHPKGSGRYFYSNKATGEKTWERPADYASDGEEGPSSSAAATPAVSSSGAEAGPGKTTSSSSSSTGWRKKEHPKGSGRYFYSNKATGEKTWERPADYASDGEEGPSSSSSAAAAASAAVLKRPADPPADPAPAQTTSSPADTGPGAVGPAPSDWSKREYPRGSGKYIFFNARTQATSSRRPAGYESDDEVSGKHAKPEAPAAEAAPAYDPEDPSTWGAAPKAVDTTAAPTATPAAEYDPDDPNTWPSGPGLQATGPAAASGAGEAAPVAPVAVDEAAKAGAPAEVAPAAGHVTPRQGVGAEAPVTTTAAAPPQPAWVVPPGPAADTPDPDDPSSWGVPGAPVAAPAPVPGTAPRPPALQDDAEPAVEADGGQGPGRTAATPPPLPARDDGKSRVTNWRVETDPVTGYSVWRNRATGDVRLDEPEELRGLAAGVREAEPAEPTQRADAPARLESVVADGGRVATSNPMAALAAAGHPAIKAAPRPPPRDDAQAPGELAGAEPPMDAATLESADAPPSSPVSPHYQHSEGAEPPAHGAPASLRSDGARQPGSDTGDGRRLSLPNPALAGPASEAGPGHSRRRSSRATQSSAVEKRPQDGDGPSLVPEAVLTEGYLQKRSRGRWVVGRAWQRRYFVLTSDPPSLVYFDNQAARDAPRARPAASLATLSTQGLECRDRVLTLRLDGFGEYAVRAETAEAAARWRHEVLRLLWRTGHSAPVGTSLPGTILREFGSAREAPAAAGTASSGAEDIGEGAEAARPYAGEGVGAETGAQTAAEPVSGMSFGGPAAARVAEWGPRGKQSRSGRAVSTEQQPAGRFGQPAAGTPLAEAGAGARARGARAAEGKAAGRTPLSRSSSSPAGAMRAADPAFHAGPSPPGLLAAHLPAWMQQGSPAASAGAGAASSPFDRHREAARPHLRSLESPPGPASPSGGAASPISYRPLRGLTSTPPAEAAPHSPDDQHSHLAAFARARELLARGPAALSAEDDGDEADADTGSAEPEPSLGQSRRTGAAGSPSLGGGGYASPAGPAAGDGASPSHAHDGVSPASSPVGAGPSGGYASPAQPQRPAAGPSGTPPSAVARREARVRSIREASAQIDESSALIARLAASRGYARRESPRARETRSPPRPGGPTAELSPTEAPWQRPSSPEAAGSGSSTPPKPTPTPRASPGAASPPSPAGAAAGAASPGSPAPSSSVLVVRAARELERATASLRAAGLLGAPAQLTPRGSTLRRDRGVLAARTARNVRALAKLRSAHDGAAGPWPGVADDWAGSAPSPTPGRVRTDLSGPSALGGRDAARAAAVVLQRLRCSPGACIRLLSSARDAARAGRPALLDAMAAAGLPSTAETAPRAAVDALCRTITLGLLHPSCAEPGRLAALVATATRVYVDSASASPSGGGLFSPAGAATAPASSRRAADQHPPSSPSSPSSGHDHMRGWDASALAALARSLRGREDVRAARRDTIVPRIESAVADIVVSLRLADPTGGASPARGSGRVHISSAGSPGGASPALLSRLAATPRTRNAPSPGAGQRSPGRPAGWSDAAGTPPCWIPPPAALAALAEALTPLLAELSDDTLPHCLPADVLCAAGAVEGNAGAPTAAAFLFDACLRPAVKAAVDALPSRQDRVLATRAASFVRRCVVSGVPETLPEAADPADAPSRDRALASLGRIAAHCESLAAAVSDAAARAVAGAAGDDGRARARLAAGVGERWAVASPAALGIAAAAMRSGLASGRAPAVGLLDDEAAWAARRLGEAVSGDSLSRLGDAASLRWHAIFDVETLVTGAEWPLDGVGGRGAAGREGEEEAAAAAGPDAGARRRRAQRAAEASEESLRSCHMGPSTFLDRLHEATRPAAAAAAGRRGRGGRASMPAAVAASLFLSPSASGAGGRRRRRHRDLDADGEEDEDEEEDGGAGPGGVGSPVTPGMLLLSPRTGRGAGSAGRPPYRPVDLWLGVSESAERCADEARQALLALARCSEAWAEAEGASDAERTGIAAELIECCGSAASVSAVAGAIWAQHSALEGLKRRADQAATALAAALKAQPRAPSGMPPSQSPSIVRGPAAGKASSPSRPWLPASPAAHARAAAEAAVGGRSPLSGRMTSSAFTGASTDSDTPGPTLGALLATKFSAHHHTPRAAQRA